MHTRGLWLRNPYDHFMFLRMSGVLYTQRKAEADKMIADLQAFGRKIRRSKKSARAFLIRGGFMTQDGKLTKRYGG